MAYDPLANHEKGPFSSSNPVIDEHPGPIEPRVVTHSTAPSSPRENYAHLRSSRICVQARQTRICVSTQQTYTRSSTCAASFEGKNQKNSFLVSFFAPEMGIRPAHESPTSKSTSGMLFPSTWNAFIHGVRCHRHRISEIRIHLALGLENWIVLAPPTPGLGLEEKGPELARALLDARRAAECFERSALIFLSMLVNDARASWPTSKKKRTKMGRNAARDSFMLYNGVGCASSWLLGTWVLYIVSSSYL